MDAEPVRAAVLSELSDRLHPASIFERVDPRVRELETLPARASGLLQGEKTATTVTMNGIQFRYDALEGQKTGSFLDQRENYFAAAHYAHGEALDVFCYQGGFALHLAPRCSQVTGVDSSRPALEIADQNAALNHGNSTARRSNGSRPTPSICSRTILRLTATTTQSSSIPRPSPSPSAISKPPCAATRNLTCGR